MSGARVALSLMAFLGATASAGCGGSEPPVTPRADAGPAVSPVPCTVDEPTECPDPVVGYLDVAPIFRQRCVTCHDGAPGSSWSLADYGHVVDWALEVRSVVVTCAMPPATSTVAVSAEERRKILEWIICGVPR